MQKNPFDEIPKLNLITKSTEKAVTFVEWLAEVIRGKNWVKKLVLLDVVLLAARYVLKWITTQDLPPLQYDKVFWLTVGLIFVAALIVAILTRPHPRKVPSNFSGRRIVTLSIVEKS
jgi:type VI protein secretion system component VasK